MDTSVGTIGYLTLQEALDNYKDATNNTITLLSAIKDADNAAKTATGVSVGRNVKIVNSSGDEVTLSINGSNKVIANDESYTVRKRTTGSTSSTTTTPTTTPSGSSDSDDSDSSSSTSSSQTISVESGAGGTVTVNSKGNVIITPDAGYVIDVVTVNGEVVEVPASGVLTGLKSTDKVVVSFRESEDHSFADVPEGYWAEDAIDWAYEKGYINGTTDATFSPTSTISRQQIWMILARAAGANPASMAEAKAWAIANEVSDGSNPGAAVTRQQLVAILYRAASLLGVETSGTSDLNTFPDADSVSDYAKEALAWAVANGIVGGTSQGTLNPTGNASRAQFAVILQRFYSEDK
jgi:hypothetical protein